MNDFISDKALSVMVFGASGFIGREICRHLSLQDNYRVYAVERNTPLTDLGDNIIKISLNSPDMGKTMAEARIIINLSGANLAAKSWTKSYKKTLWDSRVGFTEKLRRDWVAALTQARNDSGEAEEVLLLNASAIGYYSDENQDAFVDETDIKTEASEKGSGFLSDLTAAWEKAADFTAEEEDALTVAGFKSRVVKLRFGLVLGKGGGALPPILRATRWFMGAVIGDGEQIVSWIAIQEVGGIIDFLIDCQKVNGPVNICAPQNINFKKFVKEIGTYLKRPVLGRVPAIVIKKTLGKRADLLLKGDRVYPEKLLEAGYVFNYPNLQMALEAMD